MEKCKKCGGAVEKGGMIKSGNSKYSVWKCKSCGHEEMECEGLL